MNRMLNPSRTILMAVGLLFAAPLFAADGTWTQTVNGVWDDTGNWTSGMVADGSGFSANFTADITANRSVFPYAAKTIGNIYVNDPGTPFNYSINDGSNAFTLAVAAGSPLINCMTRLNLLPVVYGTAGFTKLGPGVLNLGVTSNLISGPVNLYQGSEILLNHYQALLNADVNVTGTLVKSQKFELYAKSLTVGLDGKVDIFNIGTGENNAIKVAVMVKDSITVNNGGTLGAGLADGFTGRPFSLLSPAVTVNSGGSIIVNYNTPLSLAEPGISGSNITVNSDGQIEFIGGPVYVIDNPLTLAGDGIWFNNGALHTIGNGIILTNNSPTTLAGTTRIGQYGIGGSMVMNQPISGTGDLNWYAQGGYGSPKTYYLNTNNTYSGSTILCGTYATPTYEANVDQAFPKTGLEIQNAVDGCFSYYDLNSYTQAVTTFTVTQFANDFVEVRGDASAALHVGGAMDFNGGTTLMNVPVLANSQQCQVNGGATLNLTNATMDIRPWGQLRPLWSGSGTATVNLNYGGKIACYSVRMAEVNGTPIVNVNAGGELNFADLYAGLGTPVGGKVTINGGTLSDSSVGFIQTNWIYGFGGKDIKVEIMSGGATFNIANQYRAVREVIAGTAGGNLIKTGSQTLALEVAPTFNGSIEVQQGALCVNCNIASLAGVTLAAGTQIGGTGTLGPMTIPSGATVAPGNSIGTLNGGSMSLNDGASYAWEFGNAGQFDLLNLTGTLALPAPANSVTVNAARISGTIQYATNAYFLVTTTGGITGGNANSISMLYTGGATGPAHPTISGNNLVVTGLVPEPATLGLLGALVLLCLRKAR